MAGPRAAVLGTGPGGLAIAAELAGKGWDTAVGDLPGYEAGPVAVAAQGGVVIDSNWGGDATLPVIASPSPSEALSGAELVIVSAPTHAHPHFVEAMLPHLEEGAVLLFIGEGGGALVAWPALVAAGRSDVTVGETNCLPYMAKRTGPARVLANRKQGGVLVAALPAERTVTVFKVAATLWPYAEPAESVWETVLINYDAIDTVPVALTSAAKLEGRAGGTLFWGEGATPGVVRLIEALDGELLELRRALGHNDLRRYRDFLIAQGLAPDAGDLFSVMRAGGITRSYRPSGGIEALADLIALEVGYCLVLASSLGRALGVSTPVIDAHIALAGAMLQRSYRDEGRTLDRVGLAGADRDALVQYARTGTLPTERSVDDG